MNLLDVAANHYGVLQPVVSTAGSIMGAGVAIGLTFRKRAKWEPSEEDIRKGPERVGGLVGAILIAILYFETKNSSKSSGDHRLLIILAIAGVAVCVAALLAYGFLTSLQTYTQVCAVNGVISNRKIIGGFALTPQAKENMGKARVPTVQQFFEGSAYDVDRVWTRTSRSWAKLLFVVFYLALTISGTVALASAAILLGSH